MAVEHAIGIVVFAALEIGSSKAGAKFDALDCRNGERRLRDTVLDAVEHRVAHADGHAVGDALDDAANAVEPVTGAQDGLVHRVRGIRRDAGQLPCKNRLLLLGAIYHGIERLIGDTVGAERRDMRDDMHAHVLESLLADAACDADRGGQASREMSAAGDIMGVAVLHARGIVRMARTRDAPKLIVIARARVGVANDRGDGGSVRVAVGDAGDELRDITLFARRRRVGASGRASGHEGVEFLNVYGDAGGNAVERASDGRGVRLPEDREVQHVSEYRCHGGYSSLSSTLPPSIR